MAVRWVLVKKIRMRFELEDEIGYVHRKQEHSSATGNGQETFLTTIAEIASKRVRDCWRNLVHIARMGSVFRAMVCSGNHEGCLTVQGGMIIVMRKTH